VSSRLRVLILGGILVLGVSVAAGRGTGKRFPDPDRNARSKDYIASSECFICHEDRATSLKTSFHAGLLDDGESRGCQECHGPGAAHAGDGDESTIRDPVEIDPKVSIGVCVTCHADVLSKPHRKHPEWIGSDSDLRACVRCHRVHVDRKHPAFDPKLGPFQDLPSLAKHASHLPAARCRECHPKTHPQIDKSGHAGLLKKREACGACHGAGSLHVASGGSAGKIVQPWKQKRKERNRTCLGCHHDDKNAAEPICLDHDRKRISCINCHRVNSPKGRTLRSAEALLCTLCHPSVEEEFERASHHPIENAKVGCTGCHQRSGKARRDACVECHREYQGPFRHDHGFDEAKGCLACHAPHGSAHPRLLAQAKLRDHCLSCHSKTSHDATDEKWHDCTSCHTKIHGSNRDSLFRK